MQIHDSDHENVSAHTIYICIVNLTSWNMKRAIAMHRAKHCTPATASTQSEVAATSTSNKDPRQVK